MTTRKRPGGFRKEETVYALNFPDKHPLAGLRAEMRKLSAGQFTQLVRLIAEVTGAPPGEDLGQDEVIALAGKIDELLRLIAAGLRRWNWEDDDGPVPATAEGLMSRDLEDMLLIASAWVDCFAVAPPLPQGSPNGRAAQEESLGLAASSQSLPS